MVIGTWLYRIGAGLLDNPLIFVVGSWMGVGVIW
jgi:hypothetical protein